VECQWSQNVSGETHESLVGLASVVYEVPLHDDQKFRSTDDAQIQLARRSDILENPPGSKETLTFCAIDRKTRSQPIALAGHPSKKEFSKLFKNCVIKYFDEGSSEWFSSYQIGASLFDSGPSAAQLIYGFVYELYQNTFMHGTLNKDHKVIPGLRFIRLRKRVGNTNSRNNFIDGAGEFSELATYLENTAPLKGPFKFYEISISDNGMGIVSRYRATSMEEPNFFSSTNDDLRVLNRIIAQSLSSDTRKSNSGIGGLQKALRAIDQVKGFVSLRSDNLWVYRSPTNSNQAAEDEWLRPVKNAQDLCSIPGTHFSIILLAS